jgi:hypothetical protein
VIPKESDYQSSNQLHSFKPSLHDWRGERETDVVGSQLSVNMGALPRAPCPVYGYRYVHAIKITADLSMGMGMGQRTSSLHTTTKYNLAIAAKLTRQSPHNYGSNAGLGAECNVLVAVVM